MPLSLRRKVYVVLSQNTRVDCTFWSVSLALVLLAALPVAKGAGERLRDRFLTGERLRDRFDSPLARPACLLFSGNVCSDTCPSGRLEGPTASASAVASPLVSSIGSSDIGICKRSREIAATVSSECEFRIQ